MSPDGSFYMFDGFLNASNDGGSYVISEGDPISGYVGRWIQCDDVVRIVYFKSYYWPKELEEFVEKAGSQLHTATVRRSGGEVIFEGRLSNSALNPTAENLSTILQPAKEAQIKYPALLRRVAEAKSCSAIGKLR